MTLPVIERPVAWALSAIALAVAWSLLFWYLFFVLLSWEVLQIPMGLGGAVYPVFFVLPVTVGSALYQAVVANILGKTPVGVARRLVWTLWVPFGVIALLLVVFCPMDSHERWYLGYVWRRLR